MIEVLYLLKISRDISEFMIYFSHKYE